MESRTPKLPLHPDDVKWGWISMYVCCSEREFHYWERRQKERADEVYATGNQAKIDEWQMGSAAMFDCARRIRIQLIDQGWVPATKRADDYVGQSRNTDSSSWNQP